MENQEQSGRGRGRRRRRGGRRGNGRGRGRGAILPRGPPRTREAVIRITEVLVPPRHQTPLDHAQRTFNVDINGCRVYTTVTCSAEAIGTWVQETCEQYPHRPLLVGLGVQMGTYRRVTRVQTHPFASTHVQISELVHILQLCVRNRCLIIQLSRTREIPETLDRFLVEQRFVGLFEGAGPEQLLYYASHQKIFFRAENFMNLVTPGVGFGEDASIEGFALRELGLSLRLDPEVRNGDWGVEVLDELQVRHACVEAHLAHKIGIQMVQMEVYRSL